jgi:hypothetical protein
MMQMDYFSNYKKGEVYTYGLKCVSPEFIDDIREIMVVGEREEKKIRIVHDTNSRRFLQVRVEVGAKVEVEIVLIAKKDEVLDSFMEILHVDNGGKSTLYVRGYTEGNGRIISRIRTHVPHEVFNVQATQNVTLYQFGGDGVVDCIPMLEIENKTTQSSHAVRLLKISDIEYWQAENVGISQSVYQNLKKESLRE